LLDEPGTGAPWQIGDAAVEQVLALTLENRPHYATHWSTLSMTGRCRLSESAVSWIWREFALQPHPAETFQVSEDPQFIEKVRDAMRLYLNLPDRVLVLCVDEKAEFKLWTVRNRCCPCVPAKPSGARMTRCGKP